MAISQLPRLPLPQEGSVPAGPSSAQPAASTNPPVAPSRATAEEAARQFESFFLYMLLKEMDKTVNRSSLFGDSMASRFYREMYYEQLADALTESGSPLGVSDLLLSQLQGSGDSRPLDDAGTPDALNPLDLTLLQYTAH
jgi:Rod binding domain-containing protein